MAIARCQQPAPESLQRIAGTDAVSQIAYVLISTSGKLISPSPASTPTSTPGSTLGSPPRLTAQCTRDPAGKLRFELLADFGNVPQITFFPPWKPSPGDLFPPQLTKLQLTMNFLGYTRVKPVKRQWEYLLQPSGELRYSTPGMASANMEPITFYLQYLRALPTLRLTTPDNRTLEFETTNWQQALRAEPLCHASSL
jgi:hypothetical protein